MSEPTLPTSPTIRAVPSDPRAAERARRERLSTRWVTVGQVAALAVGSACVAFRVDFPIAFGAALLALLVPVAIGGAVMGRVAGTGSVPETWGRRADAPPSRASAGGRAGARFADATDALEPAERPVALTAAEARDRELAERLRAEQAQRARVEKLATVGRMAAGIAHEVGNPLAAIGGYVHVLRARTEDRPQVAPVLDAVERECARIDRIVRGLLEFARPRRITPAGVAVNEVLASAVALLREQGVLRRLTVRTELAPEGPVVFTERHELEQVFVNLLLNAADAMEGGPGTIACITREVPTAELGRARRRRADDAPDAYVPPRRNRRVTEWLSATGRAPAAVVQVVVADSGPGIPPADWERVFDPFYTTKEARGGTGLGLAIVARTVEQLGGAVWVQRAREGGAAFVVVLPAAEPPVGRAAIEVGEAVGVEQLALPLRPEHGGTSAG